MKKILLSLIALSLSSFVFAQGTQIAGSPIYYLNGNIGIGTSSPSYKLDLSGSFKAQKGQSSIQFNDWSGSATLYLDGSNGDFIGGDYAYLKHDGSSFKIGNYSSEPFVISNAGNIGIGTASPNAKLQIHNNNIPLSGTVGQYAGNLLITTDSPQGADIGGSIGFGGRYSSSTATWTFASIKGAKDDGALGQGTGYMSFYTQSSGYSHERLRINSSGNVGIGTTSPTEKLSVDGNILIYHPDNQYHSSPSALTLLNNALVFKHQHGNKNAEIRGAISPGKHTTGLVFRTKSSYDQNLENRMIIHPDGNVGIGTTSPTEKLSVDGNILAKKVRVSIAAADWPDYVFDSSYELRALSELESYIKQNQHLPEVPSAKEVVANGLDLGNMDATLLKKVEELTLYLIQENKDKTALQKENKELKSTLQEVLARLEKLENK